MYYNVSFEFALFLIFRPALAAYNLFFLFSLTIKFRVILSTAISINVRFVILPTRLLFHVLLLT